MNHNAPKNDVCAAPANLRFRRCRRTAFIVLMLAAAASVAIQLDVSPMLTALRDEASASHITGWALLVLYTVLLVMPFVPGVEIGLALLLVFGAAMAWPVYGATVLALSIAFAAGRLASGSRSLTSFGNVPRASEAVTSIVDAPHAHDPHMLTD